jgi:hypothetical protein
MLWRSEKYIGFEALCYTDLTTLAADKLLAGVIARHFAWWQCAVYFIMFKGGWYVESFIKKREQKLHQWERDGIPHMRT